MKRKQADEERIAQQERELAASRLRYRMAWLENEDRTAAGTNRGRKPALNLRADLNPSSMSSSSPTRPMVEIDLTQDHDNEAEAPAVVGRAVVDAAATNEQGRRPRQRQQRRQPDQTVVNWQSSVGEPYQDLHRLSVHTAAQHYALSAVNITARNDAGLRSIQRKCQARGIGCTRARATSRCGHCNIFICSNCIPFHCGDMAYMAVARSAGWVNDREEADTAVAEDAVVEDRARNDAEDNADDDAAESSGNEDGTSSGAGGTDVGSSEYSNGSDTDDEEASESEREG